MAKKKIKSINFLPEFLRTEKNTKFLSGTIDQLIQKPEIERLDGFIGSKLTTNYNSLTDFYIDENNKNRSKYQFEPALILKDQNNEVVDSVSYDDLINEISFYNGNTKNLNSLFKTKYYSFNPFIDYDKFINYQDYYWLSTGPDSVKITGISSNTTSTYQVTDNESLTSFVFSPDNLTEDPIVTLYRGNTYNFEINSEFKFFIKTSPSIGETDFYEYGITNNGTSTGIISLVVDQSTPDILYYVGKDSVSSIGQFIIKSIDEDSIINVDDEITGKKYYNSGNGITLTNGMKIRFGGNVQPSNYKNKEFYVEGVGDKIVLVDVESLISSDKIADIYNDNFDASPFDSFPFDSFKNLPLTPEYLTINRASKDLNPWSRYNRWFHKDIISEVARINNQLPTFLNDNRAKRPIVEFVSNLKLYNFGITGIPNVDFIDTDTIDVYSRVVGSAGYYVDETLLEHGDTVIFNADSDPLVNGKIFRVNYIFVDGIKKLELVLVNDYSNQNNLSVCINRGVLYKGTNWWFNGSTWIYSQQHDKLNQAPLFELFDNDGVSYVRDGSDFSGNKVFGYSEGTYFDSVLNFNVKQENSVGIGSYVFKSYLMTDTFNVSVNNSSSESISGSTAFLKITTELGEIYKNSWDETVEYTIPVIQLTPIINNTSSVVIDSVDLSLDKNFNIVAYLNNNLINKEEYVVTSTNKTYRLDFVNSLSTNSNVLLKIFTATTPINDGYYEAPLSLTNNPENGIINELTLSEISDHLKSAIENVNREQVEYSLRDIKNINSYANRIITSKNPIVFSNFFIGKKENNIIDAIDFSELQYSQFKLSLLKKISEISDFTESRDILDEALKQINQNKNSSSSFFYSDMLAYGSDKVVKKYIIKDVNNNIIPINSDFNLENLSLKSVLVYRNNNQLTYGSEYKFTTDSSIQISVDLLLNDVIEIVSYNNTEGCFIPPTPTKLGLYPKYEPKIFYDDSYVSGSTKVIQGHDGSITIAFNDYRDDVLLEYEKRVFNNIKSNYNHNYIDYNECINGAFRATNYSITDTNKILQSSFYRWAGLYGVDYSKNNTFDLSNEYTWNYRGSYISSLNLSLNGSWRNIYKFLYDTDRPHTHPWEMLGFSVKPEWWDSEYGVAPYTSGNEILWQDIENGIIKYGDRAGVSSLYIRKNLSQVLPVDESGNLVSPLNLGISNITAFNQKLSWDFGDQGPAENAWRKSSNWPFAIQKLLAFSQPATYCSLMYDVSRLYENIAGQINYGTSNKFLNLNDLIVPENNQTLTSGFSEFIIEYGKSKNVNYVNDLKTNLNNHSINLFYKLNGFTSKNKLQIIMNSFDPVSVSPGAIVPYENYSLVLSESNAVKSNRISGIIIQKLNGKFVVKGYDQYNPYFIVYNPIRNINTPTITVGGISESYINWSSDTSSANNGLTTIDTTTANQASYGKFYQQGQIVFYQNKFYRVKTSHRSDGTFNSTYFQVLPSLPIIGGATVQIAKSFETVENTIQYGTEFNSIQEVYDLIIGYGAWLESQGFIFDEYNSNLNEVLNWNFSAKEFLYWTTQNWADNSLISISPFSNQIKFKPTNSVVENIFNSFYDYSLLQVNGTPVPKNFVSVNRDDDYCVIKSTNELVGMYFARLNSVQKEHALVFDNTTIFKDTIFDLETGYRQQRLKIVGFRTSDWNGDFSSPGFFYDFAKVSQWQPYKDYTYSQTVKFAGKTYSANKNLSGSPTFDFSNWTLLNETPVSELLPNFDYKIDQFQDFYSLDIDNFDESQKEMAQHLIGYTPRVYLNNIFTDKIAQYKFYQGFIKEKGTKNSISKLAKATVKNLQGEIDFKEEWAFRVGSFGSYETFKEIEFPLQEGKFYENPQIINFVDQNLIIPNDLKYYQKPSDLLLKPSDYLSSSTFITIESTFEDTNFELKTAGYPRLDDITATALNEDSLLDIANNNLIQENSTIWIGFKNSNEWDVVRYESVDSDVVSASSNSDDTEIIFETNNFHNLKKNDIISLLNFDDQVNGVYKIFNIYSLTKFSILKSIENFVVNPEDIDSPGLLFKFSSLRFENYNMMPSDSILLKSPYGTKYWIDKDKNNKWVVYEKTKNYSPSISRINLNPSSDNFSKNIFNSKKTNILISSAPNEFRNSKYGNVYLFRKNLNQLNLLLKYTLNEYETYSENVPSNFGDSIFYDDFNYQNTNYGLIFVGAPKANKIKSSGNVGGVRYSTGTEIPSLLVEEGLVKISSVKPVLTIENTEFVLLSPSPGNYQRFGSSIFVESNTSTKMLIVGAPATSSTGTGNVYWYNLNISTSSNLTITTSSVTPIEISSPIMLTTGSQWGYSISGNDDASVIAISSPGLNQNTGAVHIFNRTTHVQTLPIPSSVGTNSRFGEKVLIFDNGRKIAVSAPYVENSNFSKGCIVLYNKLSSTGTFTVSQIISNPIEYSEMNFGTSFDINENNDLLAISATGKNNSIITTFDNYSDLTNVQYVNDSNGPTNSSITTFDYGSTTFNDEVEDSGTVYLYDNKNSRYALVDEIRPNSLSYGDSYGHVVSIDNNNIYVGSPSLLSNQNISSLFNFSKINSSISGYNVLRNQDNLVDVSLFRKNMLIDISKEQIIDYLDIFDPLKGKIVGLAEQELSFKSYTDPAVYTIGNTGVNVDSTTNWLDDHVGELWWDLSTVKYFWYEQGDLTYRKNSWGEIFPGCTIDVYEWVRSEYLPSEWSTLADTSRGLTQGISGQPKFIDNSVVSIKQIVDPLSGNYSNVYYYWVKNKVTIPNSKNRRINSLQVSSLIADPVANGLKILEILSTDSLAIANVNNILVDDNIHLSVSYDSINNNKSKHTEWLLIEENSDRSFPNSLLEKKLFDSLLGRDKLGNLVPDPSLSFRNRYGVSVRPRQSLFKNRFEALRNLIEFSNLLFEQYPITDKCSFTNLNKEDPIPNIKLNEYDLLVEDNEFLTSDQVETNKLEAGKLRAIINNGKITSVIIESRGFGYLIPPSVKIISDIENSAIVKTNIDSFGRIISTEIVNSGNIFSIAPELQVRPFTVIVQNDSTTNNKWAKYYYDSNQKSWIKIATQKFNTPLYWDYIDWKSENYNEFLDYSYTINDVYELNKIENISDGQYVKVNNGGANRYIILEKVPADIIGNFSKDYNIVYSQNGTIKIRDDVWNIKNNNLSFDTSSYDSTLYDQTPDIETEYILKALKEDIFINDLKINWNLLFFKAVKYALTEQKFIDWAFKTSFINVTNNAGTLEQRSVYKLQNSSYYEDYLKESKPFHSVIRQFTVKFDSLDLSNSYVTDFDLPSTYNKTTNKFDSVGIGSELLNTYPWKSWNDNYLFSISDIIITNSGSNYLSAPTITIQPQEGDHGVGATAKAYISDGRVSFIEMTNSGANYKKPPKIIFSGGGANSISAAGYPKLQNDKIRMNKIGMKFDRISKSIPVLQNDQTDTFLCNGFAKEFTLSWLCDTDKLNIFVTLDGNILLNSEYVITTFTQNINGYNKKLSKIVFLNQIPKTGQLLQINYKKSLDILNANERIYSFYTSTENTPGLDLPQLIKGIEYSNLQLSGLDFNYSTVWGSDYQEYGKYWYGNDIESYYSYKVTSPALAGTNTIIISTTTGIVVGQEVNIISATKENSTASVFYSQINNNSATVIVTNVDQISRRVTFNSTLTQDLLEVPYQTFINGEITTLTSIAQAEFWSKTNKLEPLDTLLEAGQWSTGTFINALGINPEDLIIEGKDFYSENVINSTEEFVPGFVADTIGINVYTKSSVSPPLVFSGSFDVTPNVFFTSFKLPYTPPGGQYITVVFNGIIFTYNGFVQNYVSDWTSTTEFTINWETNELVIPEQQTSGKCTFTILGIGGGVEDYAAGVVDFATTSFENTTTAQVQSLAGFNSIQSVYVTFNGNQLPEKGTPSAQNYYELTTSSADNKRAAVNVTVVNSPFTKNYVGAWFFTNPYKYFNEVREQSFTIGSTPTNILTLNYPPGKIEPSVANIIVELSDVNGRRRLNPPNIEYYQVTSSIVNVYNIDNKTIRAPGTFDVSNTRAYVNGSQLRPGFDFTVNSSNSTVTINKTLQIRDTVAIVGFVSGEYDYNVVGDKLILSTPYTNVVIKAITFNDHDSMLVRTERFIGNPNRRYKISRPVLNDNYVWVQVNGIPLTSGLDYEVLDDQVTIQVRDSYVHTQNDIVIIMSLASINAASNVLGYRIFNDIFERTHFKRLSRQATTYLTKELRFTDTEIHVADVEALMPPIPSKKIPGVILIDGERIEFFKVEGNVLKQLRRSTLGTSPSVFSDIGTKVIDQSLNQNIPYSEKILKQKHRTMSNVNTYTIFTTSTSYGDGIVLSTGTYYASLIPKNFNKSLAYQYGQLVNSMLAGTTATDLTYAITTSSTLTIVDSIIYLETSAGANLRVTPWEGSKFYDIVKKDYVFNPVNQVEVFYGGRKLRKRGYYYQDISKSYDSTPFNLRGTISDVSQLPITNNLYNAYLNTSTNQVWVFENSITTDSYRGYRYRGLDFAPPEYIINTSTQEIVLNIKDGIKNNVNLVIVKKQFDKSSLWNIDSLNSTTVSLIDSVSNQAKFLQAQPSELPNDYYYGGSRYLLDGNGFVLTDNDGNALEQG